MLRTLLAAAALPLLLTTVAHSALAQTPNTAAYTAEQQVLELRVAELLKTARPVALPAVDELAPARPARTEHLTVYRMYRGHMDSIVMTPERLAEIQRSRTALQPGQAINASAEANGADASGKTDAFIYPELAEDFAAYPNYPLSAVCHLLINFASGTGSCSGAIVGHHEILTAGHCLKAGGDELQTDQFGYYGYALPAHNDPQGSSKTTDPTPFGVIGITGYVALNGWWNNEDYNFDVALLLNEPTGPSLSNLVGGHFKMQYFTPNTLLNAAYVNTFGYPGTDFQGNTFDPVGNGNRMYAMGGDFDFISTQNNNCICGNNRVWRGQSGSVGYLLFPDQGRFATTVISHGALDYSFHCQTMLKQEYIDAFTTNSELGTDDVTVGNVPPQSVPLWAYAANGMLNVESGAVLSRVELLNMAGQVVAVRSFGGQGVLQAALALPGASGVYVLRVVSGGQVRTHKVLVP